MGNCTVCKGDTDQLSNFQNATEIDLEKRNLDDLFTARKDTKGHIDFSLLYTTAPAIKMARAKISEWIPANSEVRTFETVGWIDQKEIECEICNYSYVDAQRLIEEQDPLAYSYWKGIDIRDRLVGEELTIMKYEKNSDTTKGICVGCFFRNDDLKKIWNGE